MIILIISDAFKSTSTQSIIKAGQKRGHSMKVLSHLYLYLFISDIENGYDRVYDGYDANGKPERIKAKDIDAIIPRIGRGLEYGASVLEHLNNNLGIFATQNADGLKVAANKLLSLQRISAAHLKVPKTVMANNATHVSWLVEKVGGLPVIIKTLQGSQGVGVMIGETPLAVNSTLQSLYKSDFKVLIQEFIKTGEKGAKDIRAIVIDGKVIVAMERGTQSDFRANLSQGGSGKMIELSESEKETCVRAAQACGLEVAGVDMIKALDGTSYIVEVNGNYGYKVEQVTGVDISTPLIEYCEKSTNSKPQNFLKKTLSFFQEKREKKTATPLASFTYNKPISGQKEPVRESLPAPYDRLPFLAPVSEHAKIIEAFVELSHTKQLQKYLANFTDPVNLEWIYRNDGAALNEILNEQSKI